MNNKKWFVIDLDLAFTFECETPEGRDAMEEGIRLMGHDVIVKEVRPS